MGPQQVQIMTYEMEGDKMTITLLLTREAFDKARVSSTGRTRVLLANAFWPITEILPHGEVTVALTVLTPNMRG